MGEGPNPTKKTVSTRLPADTHEQLVEYCEERNISQSDALRRFITDGVNQARFEQEFDVLSVGVSHKQVQKMIITMVAAFIGSSVAVSLPT